MSDDYDGIPKWLVPLTDSKTFCVLPWTHMATWTDGRALLCCVAQPSEHNLNYENVSDIWNSDHWRNARKALLKGEQYPPCNYCWKEEAAGIRSHRINENRVVKRDLGNDYIRNLVSKTDEDGYLSEDLDTFDFRLGNTCNLQCVMCRPRDSSKWLNDAKKLKDVLTTGAKHDWEEKVNLDHLLFEWYKRGKLWDDFEQYFPRIRHLIFGGGEPLLIKEHTDLISKLVEGGYSKNIEMRYHTNGTTLSEEIISLWEKFKKVELMVSIDGWGEHNEYLRYPSSWPVIHENLKRLDQTKDGISPRILASVHAMNIFYMPHFAVEILRSDFKKIGFINPSMNVGPELFHAGTVQFPEYLCTKVFPKQVKDKILEEWGLFRHELEGRDEQWDRIRIQLDFMMQEDHSHLFHQFLDYKEKLDQIRGTSYKKTFPEFNNIIEMHS